MSTSTATPPALTSSAKLGMLLFVALPCLPGLVFLLAGILTDPHHRTRDTSPAGEAEYARKWERTRGLYLAGGLVLMAGTLASAGVVWKIVRTAKEMQEGTVAEESVEEKKMSPPSKPSAGGYEAILCNELEAGEGSFLIRLRPGLTWDKAAFSRLITAMEVCAAAHEDATTLPRWIAEGVWIVSHVVRDVSSHPDFPKEHPPEYYQDAYERLDDLAFWFFAGRCLRQQPLPPL